MYDKRAKQDARDQAASLTISALCIAASLSLYQSFICTCIVLVFLIGRGMRTKSWAISVR